MEEKLDSGRENTLGLRKKAQDKGKGKKLRVHSLMTKIQTRYTRKIHWHQTLWERLLLFPDEDRSYTWKPAGTTGSPENVRLMMHALAKYYF